jgi:acetolactate synthase-1/3 small subunit
MLSNEIENSLITLIVKNKPGMLAKICGYCGENDINIEKLVLSNFKSDNVDHRIVMYVVGNRVRVNSLVNGFLQIEGVLEASNFQANNYIERELVLVKIATNDDGIPKLMDLVNEYEGKTILVNREITIFQLTNDEEKNSEFTERIEAIKLNVEILKTGVVATSLARI